MKHPHIPLYTGDWLKDPQLSICSPATRGIWIDFICSMHENGRSGVLRGSSIQLARLARCSPTEIEAAMTELGDTATAAVTSDHGIWTIANRRMQREAITREERRKAGSIGGSKTQANREANPYQTPDNDIDIDCTGARERVREFARGLGIGKEDADWFFDLKEGNGWTNKGEPIRDWKATMRCWQNGKFYPSQKQTGRPI